MDVDAANPAAPELYPALFRQYIQRSTQAALEAVRNAGVRLAAEQREQSLHTLEFALNLPAAWTEARSLLITLAPRLAQAGLRQDAALFIRHGMAQCQTQGDAAGQAELEVQLGGLELAAGRMEQARALYQASAARFAALGDRRNQARALNDWAYLDFLQQHSDSAARLVQQALDLATPDDSESTYGQFVLGCLAIERRDWAAALAHFQQALAGWRRQDEPLLAARSLSNLGHGAARPGPVRRRHRQLFRGPSR
jgi:tetratricopeptide (TPR) repeat protein